MSLKVLRIGDGQYEVQEEGRDLGYRVSNRDSGRLWRVWHYEVLKTGRFGWVLVRGGMPTRLAALGWVAEHREW